MPKTNDKAKVPREIPNAPNVIIKPATTMAIADAHVGDSEVVPNEGYDYSYWDWNELPPTSSEPPPPPKPSTASAPKLKGQEPTVDEADRTLLELATISKDFRIRKRPLLPPNHHHLPLHPNTDIAANSSPLTSAPLSPLDRAMWVSRPHSLSSASPSSPTRFQKSPFFGKKLGPTPKISRIPSVSCALDPEASAVEGPASTKTAGSIMVGGSDKELEGHSGDEGGTLRGFEAFGGENGRRPFVEILANLRTLLHHKPCKPNQPQYF